MPGNGIATNKTNLTIADLEKTVVITFLNVRLAPVYAYQSFVYTLSNTNHFLFAEQPRAMTSLGVLCMLL